MLYLSKYELEDYVHWMLLAQACCQWTLVYWGLDADAKLINTTSLLF